MPRRLESIDTSAPIWDRFFTVAPLVLIGTREPDGSFDLAPKHMATPIGWQNHFGFVCTPRHRTYHNAIRESAFTVSFPRPSQILLTSLAAAPRAGDAKPSLAALPTWNATTVPGTFIEDGYLFLECALDRVIDDFGANSLISGRVVAAHVDPDALRSSDRDEADLIHASPLLAYLSPGRYAVISHSHAFPFPIGFQR